MNRRLWLGIGILALFLILGLWISAALNHVCKPISQLLSDASQTAIDGDLEAGTVLARQARADWQDCWHGAAAMVDHTPMDEIDSLFALTDAYGSAGAAQDFAACCARLSELVEAIADAHGLTWWNLV